METMTCQSTSMLCCICGLSMAPNPARMCVQCLRNSVDITADISRTVVLARCKQCMRYMKPPFVHCEPESRQLMALCLKKIKGLKDVKVVDANFIWTEEHSKRLKLRLTIQKEVLNGAILQQSLVVEFVVQSTQCDECKRSYTPHVWNSRVQVRQRVDHKRTLLMLEQLILKHDAHADVTEIVEVNEGLDFQFLEQSAANNMRDFVVSHFPTKTTNSKELVSHDPKNNTYFHKYTCNVDIAPICKDDVVFIPPNLSSMLGGIPNFMLCIKVSSSIQILDPFTLRCVDVPATTYWKHPFKQMLHRRHLSKFVVINVVPVETPTTTLQQSSQRMLLSVCDKYSIADIEICRESDLGVCDRSVIARSHLGKHLKAGDYVSGYDLRTLNLSGADDLTHIQHAIPSDVILVRRAYPDRRNRRRNWMLQNLSKVKKDVKDKDKDMEERDIEEFKQDLEEDEFLRRDINLYKDPSCRNVTNMDDEDDAPIVHIRELMEGLHLSDEEE